MEDLEFKLEGAVIFWRCGPTSRELLNARLDHLSLGEYHPTQRTDNSALACALKDHCDAANKLSKSGRDKIVQTRKTRKAGFEVVDVERGKEGEKNYYTLDFSCRIEDGQVTVMDGYASAYDLQQLFEKHKNTLTAAAVGAALVKILAHLNGLALRPSGGIYWLPQKAMTLWSYVAEAVENTADSKTGNQVYRLETVMGLNTMRAVRDAISEEITAATVSLAEDVATLKDEEALKRRQDTARRLHQRVAEYEEILDVALEGLHENLARVEAVLTEITLSTAGA